MLREPLVPSNFDAGYGATGAREPPRCVNTARASASSSRSVRARIVKIATCIASLRCARCAYKVEELERRVTARRHLRGSMGEDDRIVSSRHQYAALGPSGEWTAVRTFAPNSISTAKFVWWNFVPKSILGQFQRLANIYFAIQCVIMVGGWSDAPWNNPTPLYISSINPFTTTSVFVAMLLVTGAVQLVEDLARRAQDRKTNGRSALTVVFDARVGKANIVRTPWRDVAVGDIVRLESGGEYAALPADVALLTSSKSGGVAFVETSGIDGETSLKKMRPGGRDGARLSRALKCAAAEADGVSGGGGDQEWKRVLAGVGELDLAVTFETPNKDVERFAGSLVAGMAGSCCSISLEGGNGGQLLLRGSSLRQTAWALGVVVFCGDDTKVRRNARDPATKYSSVEKVIDQSLFIVLIIEILTVVLTVCAMFAFKSRWVYDDPTAWWYLFMDAEDAKETLLPDWIAMLFTFQVLFNNMIPITMYATLELVNVGQARQIDADEEMYDAATETHAKARSSNLCHELGQVRFVFSDKTGTLTQNVMTFKRCSVGDARYVVDGPLEGQELGADALRCAVHHRVDRDGGAAHSAPSREATLVSMMALSHTVSLQHDGAYSAESPDELAFVEGAEKLGVRFALEEGVRREVVLRPCAGERRAEERAEGRAERHSSAGGEGRFGGEHDVGGTDSDGDRSDDSSGMFGARSADARRAYTVLRTNKFDSDRKRASVVLRDERDGTWRCWAKGADNKMLHRSILRSGQGEAVAQLQEDLDAYGGMGLRTLVFCERVLSDAEAESFDAAFSAALKLRDAGEKRAALAAAAVLVESEMTVVGATAIDDVLMDDVQSTVQCIRDAGIGLWILTGDKLDTAKVIAQNANIVDRRTMEVMDIALIEPAIEEAKWARLAESAAAESVAGEGGASRIVSVGDVVEERRRRLGLGSELDAHLWVACVEGHRDVAVAARARAQSRGSAAEMLAPPPSAGALAASLAASGDALRVARTRLDRALDRWHSHFLTQKLRSLHSVLLPSSAAVATPEDASGHSRDISEEKNDGAIDGAVDGCAEIVGEDGIDDGPIEMIPRGRKTEFALFVHGAALRFILGEAEVARECALSGTSSGRAVARDAHSASPAELSELLLDIGLHCQSVVGCRVSPDQKAKVVSLVRDKLVAHVAAQRSAEASQFGRVARALATQCLCRPCFALERMAPVTLAVGDGANDVPMIQEAQVGVGISGKEGAQAANSADFSIAQFKHLKRLLLIHGRWNYRRAAKVVLYSFYKNIVSTLCLVIFMYPSFMSGLCLFEEWMFNAYNMVLLLPILVVGFLDKDLREKTIVTYPAMYASGRLKLDLNIRRMLGSSLLAVAHAAIIMGLPLATISGGLVRGADGVDGAGLWVVGTIIYISLLIAMALRAVLLSNSISTTMVLAVAISLGAFVLLLVLYSGTGIAFLLAPFTTGGYYHVVYHAITLPTTWLLLLIVPATCALVEICIAHIATEILPPDAIRYGIEHDRGFHGTRRPLWRRRSCASIAQRILLCGDGGLFDPVEAHKAGAFVASAIGAKLQMDEGARQRGGLGRSAFAGGGAIPETTANRIAALSRQFSTDDDIGMMRSSSAFTIAAEAGGYGSEDDA